VRDPWQAGVCACGGAGGCVTGEEGVVAREIGEGGGVYGGAGPH
jgi:hypothetical protein